MSYVNLKLNLSDMAIGTIIGGVLASTATAIVQSSLADSRQQRQFSQSRQLMQEQSQLNQEQWEKQFQMQNEYNSPENQMALKQAAGLNPLFAEGNAMSNASPTGSVSLPSVGMAETPDLSGILNTILSGFFQSKHIDNETKKTESDIAVNAADVKQKDAYVVNTTNLANSQMRVDNAKIDELLSQKDLNDEQKLYVRQQKAALVEMTKQKWHELQIRSAELAAKIREIANQEYTSQWQESVARQNAISSRMTAQSSKKQADIAEKTYKFGLTKWNQEYRLQVAKFSKQCTNENIENFCKLFDKSDINVFGTHISDERWFSHVSAFCEAFVNNCSNLDDKAFTKAFPLFLDAIDVLESYEIPETIAKPKDKKSYITTPYFKDEYINQ